MQEVFSSETDKYRSQSIHSWKSSLFAKGGVCRHRRTASFASLYERDRNMYMYSYRDRDSYRNRYRNRYSYRYSYSRFCRKPKRQIRHLPLLPTFAGFCRKYPAERSPAALSMVYGGPPMAPCPRPLPRDLQVGRALGVPGRAGHRVLSQTGGSRLSSQKAVCAATGAQRLLPLSMRETGTCTVTVTGTGTGTGTGTVTAGFAENQSGKSGICRFCRPLPLFAGNIRRKGPRPLCPWFTAGLQ